MIKSPTVDMLDDPNTLIADRKPLLQQRLKEDKQKGLAKFQTAVKAAEQKITDTRAKQSADEAHIKELRQKRAELFVADAETNAGEIEKLDFDIAKLGQVISGTPDIIAILDKQLSQAKQALASECRDELLNSQRKAGQQIAKISIELVDALKLAKEKNDSLHGAYAIYNRLKEQTGSSVISQLVTRGSCPGGAIDFIYSLCTQEIAGKRPMRAAQPGGIQI